MRDIATRLGVSKASVSLWVRDVSLTDVQRQKLSRNGVSVDVIEKRRASRLEGTRLKRAALMENAARDFHSLSPQMLLLIGIGLYWGEGGKTIRGGASLSNSDPAVIRFMMRFFREICKVPEEKFRGHVHTFSHLNAKKSEEFWSEISKIPKKQFYKTYAKPSIASKNKKDSLPFGTFQIYVHDTTLFFKVTGWIERIKELTK